MMLVDRFGRVHDYLRISLTDKCNLQCFYCRPGLPAQRQRSAQHTNGTTAEPVPCGAPGNALMSSDEIVSIAHAFVNRLGINKIRITGGEPLLRKDAHELIEKLGSLPVSLTITTNGVLLDRFLPLFKKVGLHSINISLDSLIPSRFNRITKTPAFEKVYANINAAVAAGFHVKINTVAMKNINDDEINDFVEWTRELPVHVRFIEFMPFYGNEWQYGKVLSYAAVLDKIKAVYPIEKLHDEPNSTTKSYRVPSFLGTFAVISSITAPFCERCNRIRLTADGKIKNCLFSNEEVDLLQALRRGEDFVPLAVQSIMGKHAERGGLEAFKSSGAEGQYGEGRSMIAIGG